MHSSLGCLVFNNWVIAVQEVGYFNSIQNHILLSDTVCYKYAGICFTDYCPPISPKEAGINPRNTLILR